MITINGICIRNIFYMLSYAFKELKSEGYNKITCEEYDNSAELLATILEKGVSRLIKNGLGKEYIYHRNTLSTIRGRIDITESIRSFSFINSQLVCEYDNLLENTYYNQIIKVSINILLKEDINIKIKRNLKKCLIFFNNVDNIDPNQIRWNFNFNRNTRNYECLISICYMVIHGNIQSDNDGNKKVDKYFDDQKISSLFEKFVLEYYKQHYSQLKVSAAHIKWGVDKEYNNVGLDFMPKMKSDIMIVNKEMKKILIIDTKFYTNMFKKNQYNDKKTYHSNNLYQIYSYVKNQQYHGDRDVYGMLLYAKTQEELVPNAEIKLGDNIISIKNLDLNKDFSEIKNQLDLLISPILE